ncbi:MAG: AAA family ATPase, partial [Actinomycetota bacterium]
MAREVRLRLLGGFEVVIDGRSLPATWPTRRSMELVQLLALAPQHRLMRDQVIDALWPQLDAAAGAANLRKAAHHARRALGDPGAVVLLQQKVTLFPEAVVTSDTEDFVGVAKAALAAGTPAGARLAAAGYTGELLPTARYDEWSEAPRRMLAGRHLALLKLGEQWEQVLELDPLDEIAACAVMSTALAEGHRHRAIGVYGRLRASLLHELGVLPRAETEAVYGEALRDMETPVLGLVGRDAELAQVDAVLSAGASGDLLLVRGEHGMGKTVFLAEAVHRAQAARWLAISVVADEPGASFAVLAGIVEQLLGRAPHVVDRLAARTRTVLSRLTPAVEPGDVLEMPVTRQQLVGAVQRVVELAAQDTRGVLLAVDDAHRADESSLLVLTQLADREPLVATLLLAYRDAAAHSG